MMQAQLRPAHEPIDNKFVDKQLATRADVADARRWSDSPLAKR
jgi:hypothetical protein